MNYNQCTHRYPRKNKQCAKLAKSTPNYCKQHQPVEDPKTRYYYVASFATSPVLSVTRYDERNLSTMVAEFLFRQNYNFKQNLSLLLQQVCDNHTLLGSLSHQQQRKIIEVVINDKMATWKIKYSEMCSELWRYLYGLRSNKKLAKKALKLYAVHVANTTNRKVMIFSQGNENNYISKLEDVDTHKFNLMESIDNKLYKRQGIIQYADGLISIYSAPKKPPKQKRKSTAKLFNEFWDYSQDGAKMYGASELLADSKSDGSDTPTTVVSKEQLEEAKTILENLLILPNLAKKYLQKRTNLAVDVIGIISSYLDMTLDGTKVKFSLME